MLIVVVVVAIGFALTQLSRDASLMISYQHEQNKNKGIVGEDRKTKKGTEKHQKKREKYDIVGILVQKSCHFFVPI